MDNPAPRRISDTAHEINLTGCVFPWRDGQPVLVSMAGTPDLFLPVFSTADELRELMAAAVVEFASIKKIDDQGEFLGSLPVRMGAAILRVAVDPWITPEGRLRFKEVVRPPAN